MPNYGQEQRVSERGDRGPCSTCHACQVDKLDFPLALDLKFRLILQKESLVSVEPNRVEHWIGDRLFGIFSSISLVV